MKTHDEIVKLLNRYEIANYTIRPDGTVDVDGDVRLIGLSFSELPIKFGNVTGWFDCSDCPNLTTLKGSPKSLGDYFCCSDCPNLVSLEGLPRKIKTLDISHCRSLTSLNFMPDRITADFEMRNTCITSFEQLKCNFGSSIYCYWDEITSGGIGLLLTGVRKLMYATGPFAIIQKYIGRPEDIFECQVELIEAGWSAHAQL